MRVAATGLPGVLVVEPRTHADARGDFAETWNEARYRAAGIPARFVQANRARSRAGVLRGLHYQLARPQAKLVWAVRGEVFDVAVDVRRGSPTFGRWEGVALGEADGRQVYIPEGFAHGYCVVDGPAEIAYLCSAPYDPADERGVRWDDPDLAIAWPPAPGGRLVSEKDRAWPLLRDADLPHAPLTLEGGGSRWG